MLKKLKVETEMSKTYIDDNTVAMKSVDAGVRFDAERMNMVVVPEFVESDKEIPEDKRTMIELNKIANTIYECVQFTTDCPSNHQEGEGKMPVLDTKMYVEGMQSGMSSMKNLVPQGWSSQRILPTASK